MCCSLFRFLLTSTIFLFVSCVVERTCFGRRSKSMMKKNGQVKKKKKNLWQLFLIYQDKRTNVCWFLSATSASVTNIPWQTVGSWTAMQISRWTFAYEQLTCNLYPTRIGGGGLFTLKQPNLAPSPPSLQHWDRPRPFSMQTRLHNASQQQPSLPSPHRQLIPRSPSTCSIMNRPHTAAVAAASRGCGGLEEQMAGLVLIMSAFFWKVGRRTMDLSLKEGKGIWVDRQLAGSVPCTRHVLACPILARPSTHTPQSTGTGLGLNIYQPYTNKKKREEEGENWPRKQE